MDAGSIERLLLRQGEQPTDRNVRQLDAAIARNTKMRGVNVRQRVFPWGTITNYVGKGGGSSMPVFQPAVKIISRARVEIRWNGPRAMIGGVVPTIGASADAPQFCDDSKGARPAFQFDLAQFSGEEEIGIYFEVKTEKDFRAKTVKPVALKRPVHTPYTAHKLALWLRLRKGAFSYNEADDRTLFSSQLFRAVAQRSDGTFEAVFAATF